MTTWDMDTVHKVRRLEVKVRVDRQELAAGRAEVFEVVRRQAAGQIVAAARTFAVEVHPDDVQALEVSVGDDGGATAVLLNIWRPGWQAVDVVVELRGGAADGTMFTVRRDRLHLGLVLEKPPHSLRVADDARLGSLARTEHYQLAGWREVERRWVLACE